jgi:Flp pilus assembly protein TadD
VILLCLALALAAAPPFPAGPRQLLRQGHPAEAAAALERQLARDPRNAAVVNDLGFAYSRLARTNDAERMYRRAIALDPARCQRSGATLHSSARLAQA